MAVFLPDGNNIRASFQHLISPLHFVLYLSILRLPFVCLVCYNRFLIYKNIRRGYKMESVNLKIGEKLKSIRKAHALSLDDTAVLTGVSKPKNVS